MSFCLWKYNKIKKKKRRKIARLINPKFGATVFNVVNMCDYVYPLAHRAKRGAGLLMSACMESIYTRGD